ncbi:condensation domain-containing protein, partial [Variovorax sp. DT-64]|uniref:condensation domain-containing protein n=1 Tax=Variovorax sp. DT-64 TaxID=3396160 RepID=UPI003F19F0FA
MMIETAAARRIAERFSRLSAEQRRAVYSKTRAEGLTLGQFPIPAQAPSFSGGSRLSSAQLRQWFLWRMAPDSTAHHILGALRLRGSLDVAALKASFDALVQRHVCLRAMFRADAQGLAEQWIREQAGFDLALLDVSGEPVQAREEKAREEARRLSQTPF